MRAAAGRLARNGIGTREDIAPGPDRVRPSRRHRRGPGRLCVCSRRRRCRRGRLRRRLHRAAGRAAVPEPALHARAAVDVQRAGPWRVRARRHRDARPRRLAHAGVHGDRHDGRGRDRSCRDPPDRARRGFRSGHARGVDQRRGSPRARHRRRASHAVGRRHDPRARSAQRAARCSGRSVPCGDVLRDPAWRRPRACADAGDRRVPRDDPGIERARRAAGRSRHAPDAVCGRVPHVRAQRALRLGSPADARQVRADRAARARAAHVRRAAAVGALGRQDARSRISCAAARRRS